MAGAGASQRGSNILTETMSIALVVPLVYAGEGINGVNEQSEGLFFPPGCTN